MSWKLKVLEYGKIKYAEIEMAPLTLFVGDNNSGKSYLMSLLWGIQHFGITELVGNLVEQEIKSERVLTDWIKKQMLLTWEQGSSIACVDEIAGDLQDFLQEGLNRNKNDLLKKIFNSTDVKIKELKMELKELEVIYFSFDEKLGMLQIKNIYGIEFETSFSEKRLKEPDEKDIRFIIYSLLSLVTGIEVFHVLNANKRIYLPAARTGFMLTKDIINKVGRNTVFNLGTEREEISPFTRPINQFLDVMNDLTLDGKGQEKFVDIVNYLEHGMAEGSIEMSILPNKEVMYVPAGKKKGIPLRVVSAVVTELSPLILLLKHKHLLNMLFYEEPEMCLHPQLQQEMARVICRLINAGLRMMVTTHSDIILQHINNMICLSGMDDAKAICRQLGYTSLDLLDAGQVKVYQLKVNSRQKTEVKELICGKNGFAVPTFNDALDKIMDEAYLIQE